MSGSFTNQHDTVQATHRWWANDPAGVTFVPVHEAMAFRLEPPIFGSRDVLESTIALMTPTQSWPVVGLGV